MHRETLPAPLLQAGAYIGRPLRVLMLLTSLHGGGAERVAVQLHNKLDAQRFDVRTGLLRAAGPYLDQIEPDRVLVAPDGERRFNFEGPNDAQYAPAKLIGAIQRAPGAYRRMIAEFRPDVVISFLKGTNLLTWLALMNLGAQRPRWIAREGNNVLAVVREEAPNPLVGRASLALTRRAYRRADAVLANSTDMAAGLAADLRLDPGKVRMINNPIDHAVIEGAAREAVSGAPGRPYVLTVGRLEFQKAHEVLLQAFARSGICRSHALVILGNGSKLSQLQRLAAQLGIGEHVRFIGFVANPYAWMAGADLFVLPSRWEGFPTAAAEAMACGTPVLLSDCNFGPRDIVVPGESGELVAPAAMAWLIDNPQRRADLAQAGLVRVKRFAINDIVEQYAGLFEELAPRRYMAGPAALTSPPHAVPLRDAATGALADG
jgi:glycosyltransferase involved in cell wall biosynthesis